MTLPLVSSNFWFQITKLARILNMQVKLRKPPIFNKISKSLLKYNSEPVLVFPKFWMTATKNRKETPTKKAIVKAFTALPAANLLSKKSP